VIKACLRKDDFICSTYRDHVHALSKGVSARKVMAELFGKKTGCSRGQGGSMHLFDREHGLVSRPQQRKGASVHARSGWLGHSVQPASVGRSCQLPGSSTDTRAGTAAAAAGQAVSLRAAEAAANVLPALSPPSCCS
jgi:hypothetical protein